MQFWRNDEFYSWICFVKYHKWPLEQEHSLIKLEWYGKGSEVNCLFLSYSTSKRRGVVFGSKIGFLCFQSVEGVFPIVNFGFAKAIVANIVEYNLIHKAFLTYKAIVGIWG